MNLTDNRRARLKAWFAKRTLPPNEKSYLSQLIGGKASFGEKAARRLETTYGMPHGHLDTPLDEATRPLPTLSQDQLMVAEMYAVVPPDKKAEMLEQMARNPERYKALMDALLTEVANTTVRAGGGANLSWAGTERRHLKGKVDG